MSDCYPHPSKGEWHGIACLGHLGRPVSIILASLCRQMIFHEMKSMNAGLVRSVLEAKPKTKWDSHGSFLAHELDHVPEAAAEEFKVESSKLLSSTKARYKPSCKQSVGTSSFDTRILACVT